MLYVSACTFGDILDKRKLAFPSEENEKSDKLSEENVAVVTAD